MIQKPEHTIFRSKLENAFEFAQQQVRQLIAAHPDLYPMYTQGGKWKVDGETWTNWCEGFLPG
jgi:unsaturated chondroitin disaccharide hydrolase